MFRFAAFRAIREPLLNSYTRTAFVNAAWTRSWIQGRSYTPGSQSREQKYDPRDKKKDTKEKVIEPVTPRYQPKESKNEIKGPKHDILFFGTDKFSAEHLKAVIQERDRPGSRIGKLALVCPPDRYTGRKQKDITPCETKAMASLFDIPVYHTPADKDLSKLKIPETYTLGVVVSFGQFIPPDIINSFKDGAINVHPSLLPKYRGAAPIQHTILAGESETGVTVQELHEKVFDGGRILLQRKMLHLPTNTLKRNSLRWGVLYSSRHYKTTSPSKRML
ncbi:formyl transferase [Spinellus fusiger]|nr:formyl transferase [Spinellus fusiger]